MTPDDEREPSKALDLEEATLGKSAERLYPPQICHLPHTF